MLENNKAREKQGFRETSLETHNIGENKAGEKKGMRGKRRKTNKTEEKQGLRKAY